MKKFDWGLFFHVRGSTRLEKEARRKTVNFENFFGGRGRDQNLKKLKVFLENFGVSWHFS